MKDEISDCGDIEVGQINMASLIVCFDSARLLVDH